MSDPDEDGSILHPFDALVEAVTNVNLVDGMTILVNDGHYNGLGNYNINTCGKAITIRSWNGREATTIGSLGAGVTFVFDSGETTNTVLMGLTIKGNQCDSSDGDCDEIPIVSITNASPLFTDCVIQETGGNAVQCSGSSQPQFVNCVVGDARNGFWIDSGAAPLIVSNTVSDCFVKTYFPMSAADVLNDEYFGNGIYAKNSDGLTIRDTRVESCAGRGLFVIADQQVNFSGSTIQGCRGGIRFSGVNAELSNCIIQNNQAPNYYNINGTVYKWLAPVPITSEGVGDEVHPNENGAGILLTDGSTVMMKNMLVAGNRTWAVDPNWATADDGGLGTPELRGPDYGLGGGLYVGADCLVSNINMTLVDNISMTRGGGASNHEQLFMRNLISWGNVAYNLYVDEDKLTTYSGESFDSQHDAFQGIHCRSGHVTIWRGNIWYPYYSDTNLFSLSIIVTNDPAFVSVENYRLTANSPGVDLGSPIMAPSNDLDGVLRPQDGDNDATELYDLGAYEYIFNQSAIDTDGDGLSDTYETTTNGIDNLYSTNPDESDTDGDGFWDGWEIENGSDPTIPSLGTEDVDGDGLTNDEEAALGTNPANAIDPIFVDDNGPNDPFPGLPQASSPNENGSISNAYDSIQKGVDSTNLVDGMTILVEDGTYLGTGNHSITTRGKAITVRSRNGSASTMINTMSTGSGFVFSDGETNTTVVSGFTIVGCLADDAVVISGAGPHLMDLSISNCAQAAISCSAGAFPIIGHCFMSSVSNGIVLVDSTATIVSNQMQSLTGTGIRSQNSTLQVQGTSIHDCSVNGVFVSGGAGSVLKNTIVSNCAGRGVVVVNDPLFELIDCKIESNAGGLTLDGSAQLIERCEIRGNETFNYYSLNGSTVRVQALFPLGNTNAFDLQMEDENGAGILLLRGSSPLIRNCLIAENRTWAEDYSFSDEASEPLYGLGGGLYIGTNCSPTGINCTVANNSANTRGGGVASAGSPQFFNMVYWGNTASNAAVVSEMRVRYLVDAAPTFYKQDGTIVVFYSVVEHEHPGMLYSTTNNPMFVGGGDYHIAGTNSSAFDSAVFYYAPTNDIDFYSRTLSADAGCYEYTDADNDGLLDAWEVANGLVVGTDDSGFDPDRDGFTNMQEFQNNTDPQRANTDEDGDGMADAWELLHGLDPTIDDSAEDPDSDDLTNLQEYILGTDPKNEDTDGDGMPDGWEVEFGLDPLVNGAGNPDTDGDGVSDADEIVAGTNPNDATDRFVVTPLDAPAGTAFLLGWDTVVGRTYSVLMRTNLVSGEWEPVVDWTNVVGTGSGVVFTNQNMETKGFYKVKVWQP